MGYSDQRFYTFRADMVADSTVATGTATASSATYSGAPTIQLANFAPAKAKVSSWRVVVKTAPTTGTVLQLNLLNGTNTFGFLPIAATTATAGAVIQGTMTNTAVLTTSTFTNTLPNGSTVTGTITTTTDYTVLGSTTNPTINVSGTTTASGNSIGAFEVWLDYSSQYTTP